MGRTLGITLCLLACLARPTEAGAQARDPTVDVRSTADTTFRHARHRQFACLDCHTMESAHGALLVRSTADCRACHHTGERLALGCEACHEPADVLNVVVPVQRTFAFSVSDIAADREVVFRHSVHSERDCVECHTQGPSFADPTLDCQGCHEEHHAPENSGCMSCHREPAAEAHTLEVHTSCSGAGCHVDPPFAAPPPTRVGCLWCHADKTDHEPEGECVDCHFVSDPLHSQHPLLDR